MGQVPVDNHPSPVDATIPQKNQEKPGAQPRANEEYRVCPKSRIPTRQSQLKHTRRLPLPPLVAPSLHS